LTLYYLVASLPMLSFGEPPPISSGEFLIQAAPQVTGAQADDLRAVFEPAPTEAATPEGRAWMATETQIRNAVARARASRLGQDARRDQRPHDGFSGWIEKAVTDALGRATPLDVEAGLDHVRWQFADDLARAESFGFAAVVGFAVKLRIAERWQAMSDEAGRERLEALIERVASSDDDLNESSQEKESAA
jgi:hypothetical protein